MFSCRTCGEHFSTPKDLVLHRCHEDCKKRVEKQTRIHEEMQLDQHQKDLADSVDWWD